MSAQIVRIPSQPDRDELRAQFHAALAALLSAYGPLVALGDPEAVYRLAAEVLIDHRERSEAGGNPPVLNLMRAIGADLTASAADLELDLAAPDDPEPGEVAEIAA